MRRGIGRVRVEGGEGNWRLRREREGFEERQMKWD